MITVIYLPNPFKPSSRILKPFTPDEVKTLADLKEHFKIHNPADFIWAINGHHIEDSKLDTAELRAADYVAIVPKIRGGGGGGGKNVLGVVAALALVAFTGGAGGGLLGGFLGSQGGMLGLGLALYLGGSLLMGNQKTPTIDAPKYDGAFEGGHGWSVDNIRNRPGSPLPVTFGSIRTSGQLLQRWLYGGTHAGKWTQFLQLLLAAGEGQLDSITDIKVNDIPIGSISGASYEVKLGTNNQTAISSVVSQIAEQLTFSSELPMSTTEWVTKAMSTPGTRITFEFVAPAGIYAVVMQTGANVEVSMWIRGQYREVGASTWVTMWPYYPNGERPLASFNSRKPLYFKQDFTPPDPTKLYEFRIQNYTWKYYDNTEWHGAYPTMPDNYQVTLNWLSLTSRTNRALTFPGTAIVALSLPATENLSGGMPKVSWTQTRANIYAWNPTAGAYQQKPAANLAWMIYDIIHACRLQYNIQTSANQYVVYGEPAANIDYDTFNEWATYCGTEVEGVARCVGNLLLDSAEQMWPAIQKIATSARGFIIQQAGVFKPVWDAPKTVSQIFTSGNIINGSVKGGFLSEKERATAIEASFLNEDNGFERDTLSVPSDDYNPMSLDNPTQIYFPGLTSSDVVYRACKHILRRNKYLRRTISFQADIDSIVAEIGDVIGVQSDITDWGVGGRIMGATTTKVVIDQAVSLSPEGSYTLLVRAGDGTLTRKAVDAVAEAITTTELNFTGDPWSSAPVRYELYAFGVTELETKPFTITGISRNSDLQATIEGIEYVAGVYSDDTDFPVIDYTAANAAINTLTVNTDTDTGRLMLSWSVTEDRDYGGAWVYIDGKPYGFIVADQHDITIDMPPGTYGVTVLPIDGNGRGGTAVEQEVTLGQLTVAAVSGITLTSAVRQQPDGTNLIYIGGAFTIPTLATSVLIEIGEGAEPSSWTTVQDSRVPAFSYGPVKPGTVYALRFTAKNRYAVAESVIDGLTTTGDTTPPNAPSIGVSSYLKTVTLQMSLASVPSDMAGFAVYRHTANNGAAAEQIGSVTSKDGKATYVDEAPEYGVTYYYWVKSFDTWGNRSAFSDVALTLITAINGADIVDAALNRSELFQAGVVDAAAISAAALKQAGGAVAAWSAKGCTTASIAEAGGVADVTGNGHGGTALGGVTVADDTASAIGPCYGFDGVAAELDFGADTDFNFGSNNFSVAIWIYAAAAAKKNYRSVIAKYADGSGYWIQTDANGLVIIGTTNDIAAVSTTDVMNSAWHHVAMVRSGSSLLLYVDGVLNASGSVSNSVDSASDLRVGNSPGITGRFWGGYLAQPRLYARALTASEVKTLCMFPDDAVFSRLTADFIATGGLIARHFSAESVVASAIAGGAVTTEKLLVGAPGSALNQDPGFLDASAWITAPDYPTYTGWSLATITDGKVGSGTMRGNAATTPIYNIFSDAKYIPVDISKTYRLRFWARKRDASTNGSIYARAQAYNGSKTILAERWDIGPVAPTTAWTEYYALVGANTALAFPTGTVFVLVGGIMDHSTTAGAGFEIQDLRLEECLPATLIQDGAIITSKIDALAVNAAKIASGAIETAKLAAGAVTADKIDVGAITAQKIDVRALDVTDGLIGAWSLAGSTTASIAASGGIKDVSGNGKHGTASGGTSVVQDSFNMLGPCFVFDGSNDAVSVGDVYSSSALTLTEWVYLTGANANYGTLFSRWNSAAADNAFYIGTKPDAPTRIQVNFNNSGAIIDVDCLPTGAWAHVAVVHTGSAVSLYVNGVLKGTAASTLAAAPGGVTSIGYDINRGDYPFYGAIGLPRIYNRALSANEIKRLHDQPKGTITADRVVTGQIKSLNYSTTAGSMIDLDAGDVKMGGSSAPRFSFTNSTNTGVFAGFTFNATDLTAGSGTAAVGMSTDAAKKLIWAGNTIPANAPFSVANNGDLKAAKAIVGAITCESSVMAATSLTYNYTFQAGMAGATTDFYPGVYLKSDNETTATIVDIGVDDSGLLRNGSTTAKALIKAQVGATSYYAFYTNGNIYVGNNCSALSFTDRTEMPESMEEALEIINTMQPTKGKVDYKRLSNKAKKFIVQKAEDGSEYIEEGRDLTKTVSALVMVCQKLQEEVIRLQMRLDKREEKE